MVEKEPQPETLRVFLSPVWDKLQAGADLDFFFTRYQY